MRIEIRLQKLLQEAGLDARGVTQRIADDLGLHRHTVGKLYRNQVSNPSLRVIEQICMWLKTHGVTAELPQALFGIRPSGLWKALCALGSVTVYLGHYVELNSGPTARTWLSTYDVEAWARLVSALTGEAEIKRPQIKLGYVQFRCGAASHGRARSYFEEDKREALKVFEELQRRPNCFVLVGNQRVNYLLEVYVAELFGVEPFKGGAGKVPFYLLTGSGTPAPPSCFAGSEPPGPLEKGVEEALLWKEKGTWQAFRWKRGQTEAAVVTVLYFPGTQACHLALFGYSGLGTLLVAERLCSDPDLFWPPPLQVGGKQVGIYILLFKRRTKTPMVKEPLREGRLSCGYSCKIKALEEDVLERALKFSLS